MMHLVVIFLLQFLLVQTQSFSSFKVVGIFSSCTEDDEFESINKTQLNKDAKFLKKMYEQILPRFTGNGYPDTIKDIEFDQFFDVCNNETRLAKVLETILLTESYNSFQIGNKTYKDSSILVIFTCMPENMFSFLYESVGFIPVLDVRSFLYNPTQIWANDLLIMTDHFDIKELTLIAINSTGNYPYMSYYRKSVETFQNLEFCIKAQTVDPSQDLVKQLSSLIDLSDSVNLKPVVLFGNTMAQVDLLQKVYNAYGRECLSFQLSMIWLVIMMFTVIFTNLPSSVFREMKGPSLHFYGFSSGI